MELDSHEFLFESSSTFFNKGQLYSFSEIKKSILSRSDAKLLFGDGFFCRILAPDGTWRKGNLKISYQVEFQENNHPSTTPPDTDRYYEAPPQYDDNWPPRDNLGDY
ncbi:hypothetical protein RIF25_09480 [Thermosynechococcaceae cyanobacterium BACA0444]|uniref:Uncharacterized protein n=1 Tax=Pseudocalidococcus azoricus BACA0444 TaxID=2918990 RepID=A0AAE4FTG9_9CYAN|nr:hypothetical protein [Pseudocalidococcus azoricus]MDS3861039.1 hypothetical protein [Pseudocalidococcus azoricus BACA0444]